MHSSALQDSLLVDLDDGVKLQLAEAFCSHGTCTEAYFDYYHSQCIEALANQGRSCSARTHQDVVDAAMLIVSETREAALATLRTKYPDHDKVSEDKLLRTIDLAARLLTMHQIGRWQGSASGQKRLDWKAGHLRDCIDQYHAPELDEHVQFESLFDVVALQQVAGFEIIWTDNLADHLKMTDLGMSQSVCIYHHATFLTAQKDSMAFPPDFINETLRTLALLFSYRDRRIRRYLRHERLDEQVFSCSRLGTAGRQLKNFHYFRDRLIVLKQAFDQAEPSTMAQWWFDRRKKVQWSTFWVAVLVLVLTVFFGAVQSIEGALQVYKAYNPTQSG